jgi:hypothetical protein
MEEILASIRRIIAEDDSEKPPRRPADAAVEFNPDAADQSLGAARTIADSYSTPHAAPQETTPSRGIGPLSGTANANRSSTIFDLTEPLASSTPRAAAPGLDSSQPAPAPIEHVDHEAASVTQTSAAREDQGDGLMGGGLMSSATNAAVDSAFNALAQTVLVHNARTLEDLVREMLRPMLKVWLDDNLPGLVERLVRAEIERVSRGRGG